LTPLLRSLDAITLFVYDPQRSKAFYQDVFGLPVHFEDQNSVVFAFGTLVINLLKLPVARDLIRPATVAPRNAGSRLQFTIQVADTDAVCAELGRRGVELLNGPIDRPWGLRTASFMDPDGHIWEIAQGLP
jgi:catechol 2,3-dioxygenase-like lactoylglutathione lyase family enzyme